MRYLLSSLLLFSLISCGSYPKKQHLIPKKNNKEALQNPYFSDEAKDYVYKANVTAFDNTFGGIFIVKKLGIRHHRIVFTTELGNKIFDFTFQGDNFKVNHILKEMNRKMLINILKNDFRTLLEEHPSVEKTYSQNDAFVYQAKIVGKNHFYFRNSWQLAKIVKTKNGKEKVEFLFSKINDNLAKNIQILHKNIRLEISLNLL